MLSVLVVILFSLKLFYFKGSITYLGLKGILKLYYKQKQYLRQAYRQIKSFESLNSSGGPARASASAAAALPEASTSRQSLNNLHQEQQLRHHEAAIDVDEHDDSSSTYSSSQSFESNNNLDEEIEIHNNFSD